VGRSPAEALARLGEPLVVLEAAALRPWQQAVIYAWIRGDEVLYIGASSRGLARPIDPRHEKLREFLPGDRLAIWPVPEPWELEMRLIEDIKPARNGPPGRSRICPRCERFRILRRHYERGYCDWCADSLDRLPVPQTVDLLLIEHAERLEARAAALRAQARQQLHASRA